jgi:hypothetical protein
LERAFLVHVQAGNRFTCTDSSTLRMLETYNFKVAIVSIIHGHAMAETVSRWHVTVEAWVSMALHIIWGMNEDPLVVTVQRHSPTISTLIT